MTQRRLGTLAQYATRRYNLAGGHLLDGHNPFFLATDEAQATVNARGQRFLSFAHYDYLDLGSDPSICAASAKALTDFGTSVGASRLVGGQRSLHGDLERALADFVGTEEALALVSGYGTNASLVSHLFTSGDLIVYDSYAHNSIIAGTKASRADAVGFEHNKLDQLEALLRVKRASYGRVLVVVEGLYSMDGDIPDLPRLMQICRRHDAWLMIDEAHSIGVLGKTGRGITEHFGIDPSEIDLIIGTMSKALVNCGGFICARKEVTRWLRYTLPGFVYSVGLPATLAAGVIAALETIQAEPKRVEKLQTISGYFVEAADGADFDVGSAIGAGVIPVMMPSNEAAFAASAWLMEHGTYVPPIVHMGVPKDAPRLRFFMSAAHTHRDVDRVVGELSSWREQWVEPETAFDPNVIRFG